MESYFSISLVCSEVISIVNVGIFCDTSNEQCDEQKMLYVCSCSHVSKCCDGILCEDYT